ncbi:MAG: amidohydrolase family protein, partial [Desulfobacterales bacterium]|nr:amidohydrolase family protein [Desulfobacterales bacterium]
MHTQELDLMLQGDLVLPDEVVPDGRVGVKNGVIVGLYDREEHPPAKEVIDARGLLVFPGIVDAHVHSYSNPAEGFEHSTPAAAAGGVTTIVEMPYDAHGPTSSPDAFRAKVDLIRHHAKVDVALLATLKKDGSPEMIAPLAELGASGFKLSLNEADPVRFPRIVEDVLLQVLPLIAAHGLTVGFHAENDDITRQLVAKFRREGKNYPLAHCESRPPIAETLAVVGLLELAHWTRCQLHIFHASLPRTLHLIWRFREDGVNVSVETCPHYLILNETDMDRLKTFAKINPPMRSPEVAEEMWTLVKSGAIDMLTSDHAPWPFEKKQAPNFFDNLSGAPGVETLLPLLYSEGVAKRGLSPIRLARMLCENPARRFNLFPRKGRIALGADADFALLDRGRQWTLRAADMRSSAGWSPFDGMQV